jgi:tRNA A-37 threonylcarbamoyl transferase component Bud32
MKQRRRKMTLIGSGGEAEVFDLGSGIALKQFKSPKHPDFAHSPAAQKAAAARIAEHQRKIPALLRLSLPERVARPLAAELDEDGAVCGYTMQMLQGVEVLMRYGDRPFREQGGIAMQSVVAILSDLHRTVRRLHDAGVVLGDFNDLNVLVKNSEAHVIDIDSAQFGPFQCNVFTARFLDPRLTDGSSLILRGAHDEDSDWFAFAIMAFRLLLLVDPFGGIHKPAGTRPRVTQEQRALERVSVFDRDVTVPRQALPFDTLPDELLQRFEDIFSRDFRGTFPVAQLDSLQFVRCACGLEHARIHCPRCATAAPSIARPVRVVSGRLTAEEIFATSGQIVAAAIDGDRLLWLEHRDGAFHREDGTRVFEGALDPALQFFLQRRMTIVKRGDEILFFGPVFERERAPHLVANSQRRFWLEGGKLMRDGAFAPEPVGSLLEGLTHFWAGETFGFGFYRASAMTVAFVFDANGRGIRDGVAMPPIAGQIIDAHAILTSERCWFFLSTQEQGRARVRCMVIRRDGAVEASHEEDALAESWLGNVRGHTAAGKFLFAATDNGIVRVEIDRGRFAVTATFPDTEAFVDAQTRLFATASGLYAVTSTRIVRLTIG